MLGAALGAPMRYLTDVWIQRRLLPVLPWGTFSVNVAGSAVLGAVGSALAGGSMSPSAAALVGVGFCGGLTTFSSFGWETHQLADEGAVGLATANIVLTTLACVAAAALGWGFATTVLS
jgi:CrcB protein